MPQIFLVTSSLKNEGFPDLIIIIHPPSIGYIRISPNIYNVSIWLIKTAALFGRSAHRGEAGAGRVILVGRRLPAFRMLRERQRDAIG
jgi:hypothetical protein